MATWNSREKIKAAIPREQNYALDWLKTAKQFSVNSRGKFICQYEANRRASVQPGVFFSQNSRYFPAI